MIARVPDARGTRVAAVYPGEGTPQTRRRGLFLDLTRRGGISRPHTRGPHGERAVGPRKGGVRECTVRRVRLPRACWRREQAVRVRLREAGEVL